MSHDVPETTSSAPYPPLDHYIAPGSPVLNSDAEVFTPETSGPDDASTTDVAKDQAANVKDTATDAGQHVAAVAKDQASNVAAETTKQAKDLLSQTRTELQDQAATQQGRVAAGIRSLSSELGSMAERSDESGTATDLVRQVASRADDVAAWLEARDPGALVQEVSNFARRRPGAFLAIAVGAGLVAGRLTRGAVDAARDDSDSDSHPRSAPGAPVGAPAPVYTEQPPTGTSGPYVQDTTAGTPFEATPAWDAQVRR